MHNIDLASYKLQNSIDPPKLAKERTVRNDVTQAGQPRRRHTSTAQSLWGPSVALVKRNGNNCQDLQHRAQTNEVQKYWLRCFEYPMLAVNIGPEGTYGSNRQNKGDQDKTKDTDARAEIILFRQVS